MSGAGAGAAGSDLWLAWVEDSRVRRSADAYREILSPQERVRLGRFRVPRGRDEYLLGRALARTTLSRYGAPAPQEWLLTPDERGRPEIAGPAGAPRLHFNLAHSHGLVACLVSGRAPVGVDVEAPRRRARLDLLAERYFSAAEREGIAAAPDAEKRDAFFRYWTLKEAYLKALGLGIALPLRALSFRVDDGRISVHFDEPIEDDPGRWRFDLFRAASGHLIATALTGGADALVPRTHESVPLVDSRPLELELVASSAEAP